MDDFADNTLRIQEIEEMAYLFVEDGISKEKFKANNKGEQLLFEQAYDRYKNKDSFSQDNEEERRLAA